MQVKDGVAKVVCGGKDFEITLSGEGLPKEAYDSINDLQIDLMARTINQLYAESQYEKAVFIGKEFYSNLTTEKESVLPELTADGLISSMQIIFATMAAQNSIMAGIGSKKREIFNKYRSLSIDRFASFESRHPALNRHNAKFYFSVFKTQYSNECSDIIDEIDRYDYKSAILKFEKWIKAKNIDVKDNFPLLMTYYYLAELSDDFETANVQLINIANTYEKYGNQIIIDDNANAVLLADIKKYQSAEKVFRKLENQTEIKNNPENLFCLYYNLALAYKSAKDTQKSMNCFTKALNIKLPPKMEEIKLECMSDFLHSQLQTNSIDGKLLKKYVDAEIEFNRNLFETCNTLILNRHWGNSIQRMQRLFEFLGQNNDCTFLQSAYALSILLHGLPFDAEKYLTNIVAKSDNPSLTNEYKNFLEQKSNYKGVDVFEFISTDNTDKENVYNLFKKEETIKNDIVQKDVHYLPINGYKSINSSRSFNKSIIDVVQYRDNSNLFRIGAFVHSSNGNISFIPLSIYDEFSSDDFWKKINLSQRFDTDEDIYVYYGVLDTLGLEYHKSSLSDAPYSKYKLHRCSSLSNLYNNHYELSNNSKVVLYGGLEYGDSIVAETRGADKGYLEYSEIEIYSIGEILENQGEGVDYKKGEEGTIESFYKMSSKSPRIIHLATHGCSTKKTHWWNPLEDRFNYYRQNTDIQQREWLMNNTGLFMSLDSEGNNIMYANTVASCDLSQTELVVLSACSTLSGNSSDGNAQTVGLTTAFLLASSHNIITSLRDVNDEKTCEFMTLFYQHYANSNELYESFRNTVIEMKQKYPSDPHFWNSFVLVEN